MFGLFRYQSGSDGSGWRMLKIPIGKGKDIRPNPAQFQPLPEPPARRPAALEHPDYDAVKTAN
jgi:hypothetical protein